MNEKYEFTQSHWEDALCYARAVLIALNAKYVMEYKDIEAQHFKAQVSLEHKGGIELNGLETKEEHNKFMLINNWMPTFEDFKALNRIEQKQLTK